MALLKIFVIIFLIYFIRRFIQLYGVMKRLQAEAEATARQAELNKRQVSKKSANADAIEADYKVVD